MNKILFFATSFLLIISHLSSGGVPNASSHYQPYKKIALRFPLKYTEFFQPLKLVRKNYSNPLMNNTAYGTAVLYYNSTGDFNTAFGCNAMYYNHSGSANSAFGNESLSSNTNGENNAAFGAFSLNSNTSGHDNTGLGFFSLYNCATGSNNTAVGNSSLMYNISGSYNTSFGAFTDCGIKNPFNSISIGYASHTFSNNQAIIGNTSTVMIAGYANWSTLADDRFRLNVKQDVSGLDFILRLKPVTYTVDYTKLNEFIYKEERNLLFDDKNWDQAINTQGGIRFSGFSAQQVLIAASESGYTFSGVSNAGKDDPYFLSYSDFVVPLVKAVQEEDAEIKLLKQTIAELQEQNHALETKLNGIENKLLLIEAGIVNDQVVTK